MAWEEVLCAHWVRLGKLELMSLNWLEIPLREEEEGKAKAKSLELEVVEVEHEQQRAEVSVYWKQKQKQEQEQVFLKNHPEEVVGEVPCYVSSSRESRNFHYQR